MENATHQYYCGNCNNVLKEIDYKLLSNSIDSCPCCETPLSGTLQKRSLHKQQKPKTLFQRASHLPRLTFGISQIDSAIPFLGLNDRISISGIKTQILVERICVRAQIPSRHGGLESKVLLIDGANTSDLYRCVDFAQQHGINTNKVLDGIITSRAFTVYQLANTIINELSKTISQYNIRVVIITNLLYYFTNDPYLDTNEMKTILEQIINTLNKIQNCLIIISFDSENPYDHLFSKLFTRVINLVQDHNMMSVHITHHTKTSLLSLRYDELEAVLQY